MTRVLVACGGTGGHVFPALAIAASLKSMGVEEIHFAGRAGSMEERLVKAGGWEFGAIRAYPLVRGSLAVNLSLPIRLWKSLSDAKGLVRSFRPDFVVATSGYVSLPTVVAAGRAGIPVFIQEQNAVAGIANKVGARYATRIFVTSQEAAAHFPAGKSSVCGNPIRSLKGVSSMPRPAEYAPGTKTLLILGGSQGARGINHKMEVGLAKLAARPDVSVVWQCGKGNEADFAARLQLPPNVHLRGFLEGIYAYMHHADMLISRSGASTLAELLALGKPSLLVPFPFATANHQEHNARVLEKAGAALVELESEDDHAVDLTLALLDDPTKRATMAKAALSLAMPDAADRIAAAILSEVRK